MPRNIAINQNEEKQDNKKEQIELDKLIEEYYEANTIKLEKDKIVKATGPKIKEELTNKNLSEYKTGKYIAKVSISTSLEYDDDKLLKIVKTLPADIQAKLIDTVEVVNLEKFERLLITEEIKASQFKDAENIKTTSKLTIKEEK